MQIGQRIAHYQITAAIGAGGMGEVYRATDTRLHRDVALKILPPEMAVSPERVERFQREARAVAALNHPHVVTIYSVEEAEGVHFLTMELVEGESLDRLIPAGGMTVRQLLDIAAGLADALAAAHARGIVHRDLKPSNAMVTREGRVKVLDFGLAKVMQPVESSEHAADLPTAVLVTREGTVIGTMPYMSPEQLQGESVDLRTDIFSLGIMLYEMASGERPFQGGSSIALASAILRDTPQALDERRKDLPEGLIRVINRCLEKAPADRFPSAQDLRGALGGVTAGVSSARSASTQHAAATRADEGFRVAVLPFKCVGADADLAALADGLSDEIATGLSRFRYLSVVSSVSAARPKGKAGSRKTVGARPGARYVLEGSIRMGGSVLRVGAQLVDTQTGAQIWSETFNRNLETSSFFEVQDDLSARIVATVADSYGVLVHSMRSAMRQKDDAALTPAEWQFQYFAYREQITPAAHAALKSRLERALERDDRQSDLWACLAQIHVDDYAFGFGDDETALDRALAAARRAVELDRANQFALVALAQTHFFRQDLAAFGPAAERAMALNPLNTDAVGILGLQIVHTGEFERGAAIVRRAMELNANHAGWMHFAPLWEHFHKGEYEQALERANRVDVPGLFWPFLVMASACGHLGRRAEAEAAVRDLLALDPQFAEHARSNIQSWHFASGLLEPLLEGLSKAGLSIPQTDGLPDPGRIGTVTANADRASPGTDSGQLRSEEGFWVAVLPFRYAGNNADLAVLAEGLTEEIVTGLSRFSYLRVIARGSTARYANESVDVRTAGKELGARYVMEGNLRQAGAKLRLAVQLVDAVSGAHLWAENYERTFSPEAVFELQDDLVPRIVSTVADSSGVLAHSIGEMLRKKSPDQLSPYEAVLRYFGYLERATPEEHAKAREALERAVEIAPDQANCWATLSMVYRDEHTHGFNARPDPLGRALTAAHRAIEAAPSSPLAHLALACALFFRREIVAFRSAAERTIALNPMDSSTTAYLGILMLHQGDWERGCALVERARQLNPNHPGWYWFAAFWDAYRKQDYRGALEIALKINIPGDFYVPAVIAAAHGQLGELKAAHTALQQLLAMKPDFAATARADIEKWFGPGELVEQFLDGLRKAGLEIPAEGEPAGLPVPSITPHSKAGTESGVTRADEGFWVAVLPFRYAGNNADLAVLAEGLTEEIVTGLSRFSYLRVIARGSTAKYSSESGDIRAIGKALGARYVMEGSLRHAGSKLRIAAQLVDATTGAHLWAENYERTFNPDAVFELQDELVPRIVSTVADTNGILARSMSEAVRSRDPEQLTPYEAVLRSFGYGQRVTPEELTAARFALEVAVRKAPAYADAWAMLAWLNVQDYAQGFNLQADSLTSGLNAAQRAVDEAPSNHLAWSGLAQALFFQKDFGSFRNAAERVVALNPMDGNSIAFAGELLTYAGDSERGLELAARAKQLNPNYPGWYWYANFYDAYRRGDYHGALGFALKINLPGQFFSHAVLAAAYGQLGERDAAGKAVRDLLKLRPDFAAVARKAIEKWWEPEYIERMIDGWRKAGLEIPAEGEPAGLPEPDITPHSKARTESGVTRADEGFWVAVLPFKYRGANADIESLADVLSEEIVTGLSRFSYLRVIARGATQQYADQTKDLRAVGKEVGARYVMEGSLRHAGTKLRVAVQLVDATTGAHLWAENYERTFDPDAVFELQDDLVGRIVSTCADRFGVLARSISDAVRGEPGRLGPYEALMRGFGYHHRLTPAAHAEAREALEQAVERAPSNADCWAMLSWVYSHEYAHGFNARPDALERALAAARRAVDIAPTSQLAQQALAVVLFFRKETAGCLSAAERAIALNPLDASNEAMFLFCFTGDWERGCALIRRAMELNPHHPRWYGAMLGFNEYRTANYRGAVDEVVKANAPEIFWTNVLLAAAHGQLGEAAQARNALRDLFAQKEDFAQSAEELLSKWFDRQDAGHLIEGLRKAGMEIADTHSSPAPTPSGQVSIAVLPFSDMSAAKDQEYLCEGMAEEIMNALVRIDGIRVAPRTSAFRAGRSGDDLASISRALSVGHVLEGSVRTAGARLRVTAQLTDVASGYQLWSERFDREATDVFAIQDEIAAGVVEAVKSRLTPGTRTVGTRPQPRNLEAYRSYLKGRHLRGKEDFAGALGAFEEAVRLDPQHAPSWTGLAEITVLSAHMGMIDPRAACTAARKMLATAKDLQGESAEGLHVEAFVAFLERKWDAMESTWRRALERQPDHVLALGSFGISLCARQRLAEALPLFERAREADPLASFPYTLAGWGLLMSGKLEDGLRQIEDALSFEKEDASAIGALCIANVALGRFEQAIAAGEHGVAVTRRAPFFLGIQGWALAASGRISEARSVLEELRARPVGSPTAVSEAWLLGALGEIDEAFDVLARAEEEYQGLLCYTGLPGFDSLRSDPRFTSLLRRLELIPA